MNEQEIFIQAIAHQEPEERSKYLDQTCGENLELRERVEYLIRHSEQIGSFLEHPAIDALAEAEAENRPTIIVGEGSTRDPEVTETAPEETIRHDRVDDEILPGYLEPPTSPDSLGRLGHYDVKEVVGQGAFGTVLRAFDEKLQRVVAIKVLAPEMATTSPARKRFLREARTSARIRHENVVAIYGVENAPIPYLVMEYVAGKTLQQRLDETGPLEVVEVLRLGKQIADGLGAAHEQELIHRDIKPGNILLETGVNDRVKITDFGLARAADDASMTRSGMIAGTPMYMAPEQALGHKLDQRADLFSLGSVLYQMVTGRPPFRAPSTMAVLKRVTEDSPRPISQIIPETPLWLCDIIERLHKKDPESRFKSAKQVSEVLGFCLQKHLQGRTPQLKFARTKKNSKSSKGQDANAAAGANESAEFPIGLPPRIASPKRTKTATARKSGFVKSPGMLIAAISLMLLVGLAITEASGVTSISSTIVRLMTGSGTLEIETDDPSVQITIDGELVTIRGAGVEQLTLRPGDYIVTAIKDGKPIKQELVSISRNGRTMVRMSLESSVEISKSVASTESTTVPESSEGTPVPRSTETNPPSDPGLAELPLTGPKLKVALKGHRNFSGPVVFSPDGRLLVSSGPGDVCVWDVETQALRWKFPDTFKDTCCGVTFSPDGKYLLTAPEDRNSEAPISIWEAETGAPAGVLKGHKRGLYDLSFSPDGKTLMSGGWEGFARLWDFEKRRKLRDIPSPSNQWLRSAVFSSQGKIAIGVDKVYVFDQQGKLLQTMDRYAGPFRFSPDGKFLAGTTWREGRVTIWDVDTGQEFASWIAHTGKANGVAFSLDGKVLATAGGDNKVWLWDIASQTALAELPHAGEACDVAFAPDGMTVATSGFDKLVKLWDVSQVLNPLSGSAGTNYGLQFDGDADFVSTPLEYDGSTPLTIEAAIQISEYSTKQYGAEIAATTERGGVGLGITADGFRLTVGSGNRYVTTEVSLDQQYLNRPISVAGVVAKGEERLYVNGRLVGSAKLPGSFLDSRAKFSLGTSPDANGPHDGKGFDFAGQMFEVRISNVARYSGNYIPVGRFQPDEHTLLLYHFDEGQGDTLKDSSGNGRDGKIVGAKWIKVASDSSQQKSAPDDVTGQSPLHHPPNPATR